jgi:hypothetical protein
MTESAQTGAPAAVQDSSTGELVKQLSEQLSRLVRDELKLAEAEMVSKGSRAAKGVGFFGGSGVLALYGLGCLLVAAIAGLALVVATWLAALIVGVVVLVVAGIAVLIGRSQFKKAVPPVPKQAVASVRADVEEIKERAHR